MRVLYFSKNTTTHDWNFLSKISQAGHDTWFLRLDSETKLDQRALPTGVKTVFFSKKASTVEEHLPEFRKILSEVQPDILHAGPIQNCAYLGALSGFKPLIAMSWGSDILVDAEASSQSKSVTQEVLQKMDLFVCDCRAVVDQAKKYASFPIDQAVIFPWGTDLNRFSPARNTTALRKRLGWTSNIVVLSTRSWEKIYGVDVVIDSFAQAYRTLPQLRLLLLGDGSLSAQIRNKIERDRLSEVIHCAGRISYDGLPEFYQSGDIYLSCSFSDGTSVSLLEAMATGLPVAVSDFPSNREWVSDENGLLAATGSADSFAKALLQLAQLSPDKRAQLGQRARDIAEHRANWDKNFQMLLDAYKSFEGKKNG